jgi:TonB family protein
MDKLVLYLLQSQLSLVLLFWLYILVLRKHRHFRFNRLFLLLSLFASALIPLFDFGFAPSTALYYIQLPEIEIEASKHASQTNADLNHTNMLLVFYALVSFSLLLKIIWDITSIIRMKSSSKKINSDQFCSNFSINSSQNFSFFNWIFIKEKDKDNLIIMEHEQAHGSLFHSIDIILIKIYQSLFWINPINFFIEKELRLQHEYEADQWVLNKYSNVLNYQQMLLNQVFKTEFSFITNNFNQSFLKKRFTMMTKEKNKKPKAILMVLVLSVLIIPFIISCAMDSKEGTEINPQTEETEKAKQVEEVINKNPVIDSTLQEKTFITVEKMPAFPGGEGELYKYIGENISYPEAAKNAGIAGRCFLSFIIEKDGSVTNVEILRGIANSFKQKDNVATAQLLDQEALRVVKNMPKWTPGEEKGEKVRVVYRMPIKFVLE